jgi:AbrB family looped-hinge helix DNA binding protein
MISAKISAKGQVTLPSSVRKALNVQSGDRVFFVLGESGVALRSVGPSTAQALAGSLACYKGGRLGRREVRAAVKKEVARAAAQEG